MAVDSQHPQYQELHEDWVLMRDSYLGERRIKDKGEAYLSPTAGMVADGMVENQSGRLAYDAYKMRARYQEIVKDAVEALLGIMHAKPPTIELPASMESMRDSATLNEESLELLLLKINLEQLITGRAGLLLDVPDNAPVGVLPYIALYRGDHILNWDDGTRQELVKQNLNLVTLNESEFERKRDFEWEFQKKYRVLVLGDPAENEPDGAGLYRVGVFREEQSSFNEDALRTPSIGGRTLNEIPFTFINTKDLVSSPDLPPLLGLARLAVTIYRGEADYRQALFMQGQDTLVVTGVTDTEAKFRTGANAAIVLPQGADAKFIGVESDGLPEMRSALENDRREAGAAAGSLIETTSRQRESEGSLRIRVSARTANLNQIANTGAAGLERSLKQAAEWIGANPDEVSVTPNTDFVDDELLAKSLVEYMTAKALGAPLSLRSLHSLMLRQGLTELEFEEELAAIEAEAPIGTGSTNRDGPEPNEGDGEGEGEEEDGEAEGEE